MGLLSERGVTCKNCKGAEKSHIVTQVSQTCMLTVSCIGRQLMQTRVCIATVQVKESIHLPIKKKQAPPASDSKEKPDVDDLMSKLKGMPGMENIKVAALLQSEHARITGSLACGSPTHSHQHPGIWSR